MIDPVNVTAPVDEKDPRVIARRSWGDAVPDWIVALADEARRTTNRAAAERIGYSDAVVSGLLRRSYRGDVERAALKIRGALMGETVLCPVLDEIPRDRCLTEQGMPFAATSPIRSRIYRECRKPCPHFRGKGGGDVG